MSVNRLRDALCGPTHAVGESVSAAVRNSQKVGSTMERERTMADLYGHPCADGHTWEHVGGKNCGCGPDASCSVPVQTCKVCGDSDYGDNEDAKRTRDECEWRELASIAGKTVQP